MFREPLVSQHRAFSQLFGSLQGSREVAKIRVSRMFPNARHRILIRVNECAPPLEEGFSLCAKTVCHVFRDARTFTSVSKSMPEMGESMIGNKGQIGEGIAVCSPHGERAASLCL